MIDKYKEKIGFFACIDSNNNPIGKVEFDRFPTNYSFPLNALFFNFKVDFTYQAVIQVANSNGELLINTINPFEITSNILTDEKYTNLERTQASSIIQIKTPPINIIKRDMYKITLSVSADGNELDRISTYIVINKVEE
jgi:hypothetical protein